MFAYSQESVAADFKAMPSAVTDPIRPHISGPQAALVRYLQSSEKANGLLGAYDPDNDAEYDWPSLPSGAKVDLDYVRVYIQDAYLQYFSDLISAGSTVTPVAGKVNQVRSSSVAFKENGADFPRDALLLDRDVTVGDIAYIRGTSGSDQFELWTRVTGFVGEVVDGGVAAAESDDINSEAQSLSVSTSKIAGDDNCIHIDADATSYDGLEDGDIDETYTIEVIGGSIGNDLTTATLRVTSTSGNDDVSSVTPSAHGEYTNIGTRGLRVLFDFAAGTSCSSAAVNDGVSLNDFIAGQKWRVSVTQAFTPPAATSGGAYTGDDNTTYIIEVTKGGLYANSPEITITTSTGVDVSGPTPVTAASLAVAAGTRGVTVYFDQTALRKGDKYTIEVTAENEGSLQTLVLGNDLPADIRDAADLDLKLYIKKDFIEVSKNRTGSAPLVNWVADANSVAIHSGIDAFDENWTNNDGEVALPVKKGTVYVQYRAWLTDFISRVGEISDISLVEATLGTVHPDNPLAYGVYKALLNSNGGMVKYTGVDDPSLLSSWSTCIGIITGRNNIYSLVPLSQDPEVLALFATHIAAQSTDKLGLWRAGFFSEAAETTKTMVNSDLSSDASVVLATLEDDPDEDGTQYTLLRVTSNNAQFVTLGVRAGDIVRYLYTTDGFGGEAYTEFVISSVVSEETVLLTDGHSVPISTPQKIEVWRNPTRTEIAAAYAARATSYGTKRVCLVWPDVIGFEGLSLPGYYLCAALAGLRGGAPPHQGLGNVELMGFDDVTRATEYMNSDQLNAMVASGVWVVTEESDGTVATRDAVTTGDHDDVNAREEVARANLDSISRSQLDTVKPFLGNSNITNAVLTTIRTQLTSTIETLRSTTYTTRLGGQIVSGTVTTVRPHSTEKDRVVVAIDYVLPYPVNEVEFTQTV